METTVTNNNLRTRTTLNQDNEFTSLKAKLFILKNIDLEGYDLKNTAENLYNIFISEYGFIVPRLGIYNAFQEWLRGAPSAINLPIYYYDVNNVLEDELNALIYIRREYKEQTDYIQAEDDTRQYQHFLDIITANFFELAKVKYKY